MKSNSLHAVALKMQINLNFWVASHMTASYSWVLPIFCSTQADTPAHKNHISSSGMLGSAKPTGHTTSSRVKAVSAIQPLHVRCCEQ